MTKERPALIGIDWGTTHARGLLISASGQVLKHHGAPELGALKVAREDFPAAFAKILGSWAKRYPDLPTLMVGMVGSTIGWRNTGYLDLPARDLDIARRLQRVPLERPAWIVAGLRCRGPSGELDLMRGEETQLIGASVETTGRQIVCLPGTHAKWVEVVDGAVTRFQTFMTGELYGLLKTHSILAESTRGDDDDPREFDRGVTRSGEPGGLLHHLFGVRSRDAPRHVGGSNGASYLSGLLIGHELRSAQAAWPADDVTLVGAPALTARYRRALKALGVSGHPLDGPAAVARGLARIAAAEGLIQGDTP